ncbi:MAG: hypothetical protein ACK4QP_11110 [Pseudorhizobium sp.]
MSFVAGHLMPPQTSVLLKPAHGAKNVQSRRKRQMKRTATVLAVALGLQGCLVSPQIDDIDYAERLPSEEAKSRAVVYVVGTFWDPESIRDPWISGLVRVTDDGYEEVCVRFTARDPQTRHYGLQRTLLRIKKNGSVGAIEDAPQCQDRRLQYSRLYELRR